MNRLIYRLLWLNHMLRQWLRKQMTPAGFGLLGALFVFGLIGLDIKRSISYQIFVFLLATLLVSFLLSRFGRYRFSVVRKLPRFGTVGSPLKYQVVINNKSRNQRQGLSLIESFADTFPTFQAFRRLVRKSKTRQDWIGRMAQRRWAFAPAIELPPLSAQGETTVPGEIVPLRRGVLRFKKLTLACPEPLGLVNRCVSFTRPQSVLILPRRYELPTITLPGARRQQSEGLALASSVGDSEEFRALREYRPGDSPRKIHWKSWAKLGKPVIREEQTEYSVRHALILDTFQAEDYSEVMEEAVAIAASLACTVQTQESLLDLVFVSGEAHSFTVGRGLGQTEQLLELLASVVPCQDQGFESLLPVVRSRLSLLSGCICVFLAWDDDRKALIEQLQSAGVPVLVLIIAPDAGLAATPDTSCLTDKQSSLHVLTVDTIQAGLLAL
ncbi:MAG: DUF58 domain-containing protein [Cyanobacteria bacterium J06634_5]